MKYICSNLIVYRFFYMLQKLYYSQTVTYSHWITVLIVRYLKYLVLTATVHRCLMHKAPHCCILATDTARRQHLRSAGSGCHQLIVPRHRRSTFGRRAFSVAGPVAWNSLPDYLRDPTRSVDSFRRDLKTFLFSLY